MKSFIIPLSLILASCAQSDDVTFNFPFTAKNTVELNKFESASKVLFEKCPALKEYRGDIIEREAVIRDAEGYSEKRDFGWKDFVEFNVEIKGAPQEIPVSFHSAGHHCLYRVYDDELVTVKTVCAHICIGESAEVDSSYSLYIGKSALPKRAPL